MLTTMSSFICKYKKESSEVITFRLYSLFYVLSSFYSLIILSYYNYIIRSIFSYHISESDFGYCEVCVLINRTGCNVLGVIKKQLINFAVQHIRLEDKVQ